ncbi:hypothetical protein J6590_051085 [Homalodisca vitripennis]|nr:hypothetical protein J6590_051085 [Homalodisca vitripennis]
MGLPTKSKWCKRDTIHTADKTETRCLSYSPPARRSGFYSGELGTWETYHEALAQYNRKVRTAKRLAWKKLCTDIDNMQGCARLQKLLAKNSIPPLGGFKDDQGIYITEPESSKSGWEYTFRTILFMTIINHSAVKGDLRGVSLICNEPGALWGETGLLAVGAGYSPSPAVQSLRGPQVHSTVLESVQSSVYTEAHDKHYPGSTQVFQADMARERYAIFNSLDKRGEFPQDLIGCGTAEIIYCILVGLIWCASGVRKRPLIHFAARQFFRKFQKRLP